MSTTTERIHRSLRFTPTDLAEIDRRAKHYGLDRTRFLTDAALERLPSVHTIEERFQQLEQRLQRLEDATFGD